MQPAEPTANEKVDKPDGFGTVLSFKRPEPEPTGAIRSRRYTLTPYTLQDIDDCIAVGEMMHNESSYRFINYNKHKLQALLEYALDKGDDYLGLVARDNATGEVVGFGLFCATPYYFSNERAVYDMCSFVVPKWRGTTIFPRIIAHAIQWTAQIGAREFVIGTTTEVETEKVEKMFERMSLDRVGVVYKMRIKR